MRQRLIVGLCLLALLVLALLYLGHWIGPNSASIRSIRSATFVIQHPGQTESTLQRVSLPHKWTRHQVTEGSTALYLVEIPPHLDHESWAIGLQDHMPLTEIALNGVKLSTIPLSGRVGEVLLADLGVVSQGQLIELRVPTHFGLQGGLGIVRLGPKELVLRQAYLLSKLREVSHLWIIGMALAVAIFALGAHWLRRDTLLLALGGVAGGIFLHHALPFVFGYWKGDDLELALYSSSSTLVAVGLFFLMEKATDNPRDALSSLVLLGLPLVAGIQLAQMGDFEHRRLINITFIVTVLMLSCIRYGRRTYERRQWLLLMVLIFFLVRAFFAVTSFISNDGLFGYDDVEHQIRLTPLAVLAAMLLGARHIYLALKNYEIANIELHQENEAYRRELATISEREKALAVEQAATAERLHWMQEIHDGLGSHLIAARILTDKASNFEDLNAIRTSIDEGIEELRELVESLSPEQSTVPSLLGALRYRIIPRLERAGLTLMWSIDPMIEARAISPIEALNVQRITQEALTNILKHAEAKTIHVHIFTKGTFLIVRIDDDGLGLNSREASGPGRGLHSMKKRAQQCQGELTLTNLNPGTRIELSLPNDPHARVITERSEMSG